MDGWKAGFAPSFLENGRAQCAVLRAAGPPEGAATSAVP